METEAKYTLSDPAVFNALLERRALGGYNLHPTGERHLLDHYLDTAERALLRGGYACRLREGEPGAAWLLTVKALGKAVGAVHQREEHECAVLPRSTLEDWPEGPGRDIVTRLSEGRPLSELLALRQLRAGRSVERDGRSVGELSFDTVETEIAGSKTLSREIEVELGPSGSLEDLRAIDAELDPYKLERPSTSKFERALAMLDEAARRPRAKRRKALGVRADEPMAEAGRKILRFHFQRVLDNEADTRKGEDIEALHHMRVATRRQRAAFRVAAPYFRRRAVEVFRDALRVLAGHLGEVRDLDVLIGSAERFRSSLTGKSAAAFDALLGDWRGRREEAHDRLLHHLDGDDYRAFAERFGEFLSTAGAGIKDRADDAPEPRLVRQVLPAVIWEHYGRLRAYETVMAWASIETLHALRIEAKRLRYLLEFFAEVLGPGVPDAVDALVGLQDHIGELHDADASIRLLRDFLMHSPQAANQAVSDAVGRYLKLEETHLRTLERTLKRPWRRVAGKRLRGTLSRAVAQL